MAHHFVAGIQQRHAHVADNLERAHVRVFREAVQDAVRIVNELFFGDHDFARGAVDGLGERFDELVVKPECMRAQFADGRQILRDPRAGGAHDRGKILHQGAKEFDAGFRHRALDDQPQGGFVSGRLPLLAHLATCPVWKIIFRMRETILSLSSGGTPDSTPLTDSQLADQYGAFLDHEDLAVTSPNNRAVDFKTTVPSAFKSFDEFPGDFRRTEFDRLFPAKMVGRRESPGARW